MITRNLLILTTALTLQACAPSTAVRGNLLTPDKIEEVEVGTLTKNDLIRAIGSPTTVAPFDANIWYYIGQQTEKQGFLDREIIDQIVYQAQFDEEGTLTSFNKLETEDIDVAFSEDKTPTYGNDISVVQQLLGNLGRFNPAGAAGNDDFGGGLGGPGGGGRR